MRPLTPDDLVRGQYAGYRKEPDVAENSDVETFCALRLFIDSWRWEGVPWFLRSGKYLAETATEILVELKPPPQRLFADSVPTTGRANYLRFRVSPDSAIGLAARVKRGGKEFVGDQRELYLVEEQPEGETPYELLLGDAMAGDGALFTREDAVEAAWAAVDPCSRPTMGFAVTIVAVWVRQRLTRSSPLTAVGIIPQEPRKYRERDVE